MTNGVHVREKRPGDMIVTESFDALKEYELCKAVGDALHKAYPAPHVWAVSIRGGALYVQNMALNGQWGYVLHPHLLPAEGLTKIAMRCGGEILERYRISRTKAGGQQALDYLKQHPDSRLVEVPR